MEQMNENGDRDVQLKEEDKIYIGLTPSTSKFEVIDKDDHC